MNKRGYRSCLCPPVFNGTSCEITPCMMNPCNNGTCEMQPDLRYKCRCNSGFTGAHCEDGKATFVTFLVKQPLRMRRRLKPIFFLYFSCRSPALDLQVSLGQNTAMWCLRVPVMAWAEILFLFLRL